MRTSRLRGLIAAAAVMVVSLSVQAADRYWVGGDGDWSDPANWAATDGGPGGATLPSTDDDVFLLQSDAIDRIVTYSGVAGPVPELGGLDLDATGAGSMTLSITGGEIQPYRMHVGLNGSASVAQAGGTVRRADDA